MAITITYDVKTATTGKQMAAHMARGKKMLIGVLNFPTTYASGGCTCNFGVVDPDFVLIPAQSGTIFQYVASAKTVKAFYPTAPVLATSTALASTSFDFAQEFASGDSCAFANVPFFAIGD